MTYQEMQQAEAAYLIAVNMPTHTTDGECACLDCHYAKCDAEHAARSPNGQYAADAAFHTLTTHCWDLCPKDGPHEATCYDLREAAILRLAGRLP